MSDKNELARIEMFSDGVFAIAVTLLVLEIKVPHIHEGAPVNDLLHELVSLWPSYMGFAISFGSILVMWVNHHNAVRTLVKSSKAFMFANGFLLLMVTFIPFPTAVLAEYITTPYAPVAATFYSFSYLLCNIAFNVWWLSMLRPRYLLDPAIDKSVVKRISIQIGSGFFVYLVTTIISWWFPIVGVIMLASLFALWVTMSVGEKQSN